PLNKLFDQVEYTFLRYEGMGFYIQINRFSFPAGLNDAAREQAFTQFIQHTHTNESAFKITSESEVTISGVKGREEKFEGKGVVRFRRLVRSDTSAYNLRLWAFDTAAKHWMATMVQAADTFKLVRANQPAPKSPVIDASAWQIAKPARCG